MAKFSKQMSFSNAEIDVEQMTITERDKDDDIVGVYPLREVLEAWDGMTGLSITIKRGSDFSAMPTLDELKEGSV